MALMVLTIVLFIFVNPATISPAATAKRAFSLLAVLAFVIVSSFRPEQMCAFGLVASHDSGPCLSCDRLALSCTLLC
ncbi:MAG: hypothetical protein ROO76_09700 [Terriglobia bacterium]|jgi:hypothetical protein|nr:hypothetical protein [Terriglobia bacterium]